MRKKKQKKNYGAITISVFIVVIMIMSILCYIFADTTSSSATYKNAKFIRTNQGWRAEHEEKTYLFSFLPQDVEQIEVPDINLNNILEIDMTYEVNSSAKQGIAQSIFEISNVIAQNNIFVRTGFTGNNSFGLPIIRCDDSTQFVPVFYYVLSNESKISKEGNCLILEGRDDSSFLPLADRLAYKIIGIMD